LAETPVTTWAEKLNEAIQAMIDSEWFNGAIAKEHVQDTPRRVVQSFTDYFSGLGVDAEEVLRQGFEPGSYDEMIYVRNIRFTSFCAHHFVPFIGTINFAYIPEMRIVGLSKIPRLIEVLSHRPQVQEQLTAQIADIFQKVVKPQGCGVTIEAVHLCMTIRGVRKEDATTKTTALTGIFRKPDVKSEFLDGVRR
jgi:GTP cyclohydrolase IA